MASQVRHQESVNWLTDLPNFPFPVFADLFFFQKITHIITVITIVIIIIIITLIINVIIMIC